MPIFLECLAYHLYWEALVVFAIGGMTDFFDGLTARWMNQQTALGAYLDPVADKLLVISFVHHARAHRWHPDVATVVVVVRDVLIVVGYAAIYLLVEERHGGSAELDRQMEHDFPVVNIGGGVGDVARCADCSHPFVLTVFIALSASATVVSGLQYLYRGLIWLQNRAPSITPPG